MEAKEEAIVSRLLLADAKAKGLVAERKEAKRLQQASDRKMKRVMSFDNIYGRFYDQMCS
jgi:hypothetical protein